MPEQCRLADALLAFHQDCSAYPGNDSGQQPPQQVKIFAPAYEPVIAHGTNRNIPRARPRERKIAFLANQAVAVRRARLLIGPYPSDTSRLSSQLSALAGQIAIQEHLIHTSEPVPGGRSIGDLIQNFDSRLNTVRRLMNKIVENG